jgi:hypothetical protein
MRGVVPPLRQYVFMQCAQKKHRDSFTLTFMTNYIFLVRLEVFTVVKSQVEVFWVVTLCSVVLVYQRFG